MRSTVALLRTHPLPRGGTDPIQVWLILRCIAHRGRQGVPDKWQRRPRLTAVLRPETEQYDSALPDTNLSQRDLPAQPVLAEQPATQQYIVFRIARNHPHIRVRRR